MKMFVKDLIIFFQSPLLETVFFFISDLQTYLKNNGLIVTEYPQSEDAVDFLRLILDNKSDTIICMDPLSEIQSVSAICLY